MSDCKHGEYSLGVCVECGLHFTDIIDQLTTLQSKLDEAIDRINDMLAGDDGQAWKEAEKFVANYKGEINMGLSFDDDYVQDIKELEAELKDLTEVAKYFYSRAKKLIKESNQPICLGDDWHINHTKLSKYANKGNDND